jgi:hypothetical protein
MSREFYGGGGGAGGMVETANQTVIGTTSYGLSVGTGGTGGQNGANSILNVNSNTVTAIGGGGGGHGGDGTDEFPYGPGKNGGSGGGGYYQGQGTVGQGFAGGFLSGGGGAGGVAPDSFGNGGNGGIGRQSSITGTAIYYAGGGAGLNGTGGLGGGGSNNEGVIIQAVNGLGGGGAPYNIQGLSGGSGVIILRLPSFVALPTPAPTTPAPTTPAPTTSAPTTPAPTTPAPTTPAPTTPAPTTPAPTTPAPTTPEPIPAPANTVTVLDLDYYKNYATTPQYATIDVSATHLNQFILDEIITVTYNANNTITGIITNIIGTKVSFLVSGVTTNASPATIYTNETSPPSTAVWGPLTSNSFSLNTPPFPQNPHSSSSNNYIVKTATCGFRTSSSVSISFELINATSGTIHKSPDVFTIPASTATNQLTYSFNNCFIPINNSFSLKYDSTVSVNWVVANYDQPGSSVKYYGTLTGYPVSYTSGTIAIAPAPLVNLTVTNASTSVAYLDSSFQPISGTVPSRNGYTVVRVLSEGESSFAFTSQSAVNGTIPARCVIVGGGGSGGHTPHNTQGAGGGGGGGGVKDANFNFVLGRTANMKVGRGGDTSTTNQGKGDATWVSVGTTETFQADGGGAGSASFGMLNGSSGGGAMGGIRQYAPLFGSGIAGQGFNGGSVSLTHLPADDMFPLVSGAGGGGAGQVGGDGTNGLPGNGGNGVSVNITGTQLWFGGGGGGGRIPSRSEVQGQGGIGGGGNSSNDGESQTGGGGGGGTSGVNITRKGIGGSGTIIFQFPSYYKQQFAAPTKATGPTYSISGNDYITTFTYTLASYVTEVSVNQPTVFKTVVGTTATVSVKTSSEIPIQVTALGNFYAKSSPASADVLALAETNLGQAGIVTTPMVHSNARRFGLYENNVWSPTTNFNRPRGIAVTKQPNNERYVYVADTNNHMIKSYSINPADVVSLNGGFGGGYPAEFNSPHAIAINPAHTLVAVTDTGNNRIKVFNTNTGTSTNFTFGGLGSTDGKFNNPMAVAYDRSGNIIVGDSTRIQLFSSSGTFISKWATPHGTNDGEIHYPTSIAVNKIGHVIVSGSTGVQMFNANGTFLMKLVAPQGGAFSSAHVAVDNKGVGQIIVSDSVNSKIHLYDSAGTYISSFGSVGSGDGEFNEPNGVAIDENGNIYVCDRMNNRIQYIT